jgi:hypothetical protein
MLRRRARKIAMMLDPESDRECKERATRRKARVEVFPERSGNHAFAGRELPAEEALACDAYVKGMARYLKARGVPGSPREIGVMVYLDLNQGRDPRARIPGDHAHGSEPHGGEPASQGSDSDASAGYDYQDGSDDADGSTGNGPGDSGRSGGPWPFNPPVPGKPGGRAPFPAKINLLVPVGSLLGWSAMPGEAGREIIGPDALRNLVQAASHHPATRWSVTVLGADRAAIAHGYVRGQHPWNPELVGKPGSGPNSQRHSGHRSEAIGGSGEDAASRDGPTLARNDTGAPAPRQHAPDPGSSGEPSSAPASRSGSRVGDGTRAPTLAQQAQLARLLGWLKPDLASIATGTCDHAHCEDGYRPTRKLQAIVRARNGTCPAPGCSASSAHCDIDHTKPWPEGDTDQCNLGSLCRHHHRAKQAPGWRLEQPLPGVFRWQTPTGHVYHVNPTAYDI